MSTVVGFVIGYFFLAITNAILSATTTWSQTLMKEVTTTVFSSNMVNNVINLLPFSYAKIIPKVIFAIAWGIIGISLITTILKSMTSNLTGEKSLNPIQIVGRVIVSALLFLLFFGKSGFNLELNETLYLSNTNSLLGFIGNIFSQIMQPIIAMNNGIEIKLLHITMSLQWGLLFVYVVLAIGIFYNVFTATIAYLERLITFALYILLGPICCAMYVNPDTEHITKRWIKGIFTSLLVIFISTFMWGIFLTQMSKLVAFDSNNIVRDILNIVLAMVFLDFVSDSEKMLNQMGFSTIINSDAARMFMQGIATAVSTYGKTSNNARKVYEWGVKSAAKADSLPGKAKQVFSNMVDNSRKGGIVQDSKAPKNPKYDKATNGYTYMPKAPDNATVGEHNAIASQNRAIDGVNFKRTEAQAKAHQNALDNHKEYLGLNDRQQYNALQEKLDRGEQLSPREQKIYNSCQNSGHTSPLSQDEQNRLNTLRSLGAQSPVENLSFTEQTALANAKTFADNKMGDNLDTKMLFDGLGYTNYIDTQSPTGHVSFGSTTDGATRYQDIHEVFSTHSGDIDNPETNYFITDPQGKLSTGSIIYDSITGEDTGFTVGAKTDAFGKNDFTYELEASKPFDVGEYTKDKKLSDDKNNWLGVEDEVNASNHIYQNNIIEDVLKGNYGDNGKGEGLEKIYYENSIVDDVIAALNEKNKE